MQKRKLTEISVINVLLCMMTIFIHVISYPVASPSENTQSAVYIALIIIWRLSVIVVPGFIMLAGCKLFLKISSNQSFGYKKYYASRFKRLIIPYIIWFAIYYICYMILYGYQIDISFMLKHFIWGSLAYHLYFIPIIVQFDLLIPIWKPMIQKTSPIMLIPCMLILTMLCEQYMGHIINLFAPETVFAYNDRIVSSYAIYWIIGAYMGYYYDSFKNMIADNKIAITIIFAISAVTNAVASYFAYCKQAVVPFLNTTHMMYTISVLMFVYMISLKYGARIYERFKIIAKIDSVSYRIYLCHVMLLAGIDLMLEKYGIIANIPTTIIRTVLIFPLSVTFSIFIEKTISLLKPKKK